MPLTSSAIQAVGVTALEDCERTRTGCGGGGGGGGGGGEPVGGCNPELTQESVNPDQNNPEFGGRYSTVMFGTRLACTSGIQLASVRIQTQLWDRTGGGRINALAKAPERTSINVDSAQTVDLYDIDYYPAAQQAEVVQLAQLDAGPGRIWQCNNNATLSFLWCSGVGTRYLSAVVGFGSFSTGVAAPCKTDVESRTVKLQPLNSTVTFTPHIKWCWSGTTITSVRKIENQNTTHTVSPNGTVFTIKVTLDGEDITPFIDNSTLPQAGIYHVRFIITSEITPGVIEHSCMFQLNRIYLAGGVKEKEKQADSTCQFV
jgi:hypothetical protein